MSGSWSMAWWSRSMQRSGAPRSDRKDFGWCQWASAIRSPCLGERAPFLEQVFAVVLGSWLAFLSSRARYSAVGQARESGEKELILSVTERGYGKRTPITDYRLQSRAGKGVINVKTTERNGKVVNVLSVTEESEVMIISQQGKITRLDSGGIRESGRSAQGVRLISLGEGDQVAAACLIMWPSLKRAEVWKNCPHNYAKPAPTASDCSRILCDMQIPSLWPEPAKACLPGSQ